MTEIKHGYKQTDVGVIPEDWENYQLGQISHVIMGQSPIGSSYNKNEEGIPLINGPTEFTDKTPIKIQWTSLPTKLCKKDDLLICVRGSSTGRINISNDEYCIGRGVAAIRANSKSNTEYITHQVYSGVQELLKLSAGSTFPNIDGKAIKSIQIPLPKPAEQRVIAEALSDVDGLIERLEELVAKKRDIKTATMQQLLTGKKRLPDFDGDIGYKQTDVGLIPEDWGVVPLGNFITINSGESPSKFNFQPSGIPYFKVEQLNNGIKYAEITEYFFFKGKTVPANSVIFPKRGASILLNKIRILKQDSFMDTNLMTLTCHDGLGSNYLFYYLSYTGLDNVADTTSIPQINNKHIYPFLIPLPTTEEQTAIATILSDMDTDIEALEERLTKTRSLKSGMMQELLTGKTRLLSKQELTKVAA